MTARELLEDYLDREHNNVFCYSSNWMMDTPRKGYEREFADAEERCALLEALLAAQEAEA